MKRYDTIIVGAGSAGSVLAAQLSADPEHSVLLVEEGGSGDSMLVHMPKGFGKLLTSPETAHFFPTVNTREGGAGQEVWVRGRMLGGSSGVNGMVWNRGAKPDWDRLAELAGPDWSWDEIEPIFRAIEAPGPIPITTCKINSPLLAAWIAAGQQIGLPFRPDHRAPGQEGIGPIQFNIDAKAKRVSAARAFLKPAMGRSNLTVVTGMRTDRVLLDGKKAVGITGIKDGKEISFEGENVILSAGGIASPRILQLSGIGPADVLEAAGVPVVLAQPDIGRKMREHVILMQHYRLRDASLSNNGAFSGAGLVSSVMRHMLRGTGPLSTGASDAAAFVKAMPRSPRPDSQLMYGAYSLDMGKGMQMESEPGMQVYGMMLRPESEGRVAITSADPAAMLRIDPQFLSAEYDRQMAVAQTRYIRDLMAQPALSEYLVGETELTAKAQTDEEIVEMYRLWGQSGYHAVGTVRMGTDESTPLTPDLRLRGIGNLRVCDCSAFPEMIAGNTNAPAMALAMQTARLIRRERAAA